MVDKSAETALDESNDRRSKKFQSGSKPPPYQSGREKSRVNMNDLFSPRVKDAILTTVMGLSAVGLGGILYQTW